MNDFTINLINRLLTTMNLVWEKESLFYTFDLQFGKYYCIVSNDFNDVLKVLKLPNDLGTNLIYDCQVVASNKFFNWDNFKHKKHEIKLFLDVLRDSNVKSSSYTKKRISPVHELLKSCNININECLWVLHQNSYDIQSIRNKFNGHLVKSWTKTNEVGYFINGFQEYIIRKKNMLFDEYLIRAKPKEVRLEFLDYFTNRDLEIFPKDDKLPFLM